MEFSGGLRVLLLVPERMITMISAFALCFMVSCIVACIASCVAVGVYFYDCVWWRRKEKYNKEGE